MDFQFESLLRESRIRKGVILYGNTRDEYFDKKSKSYFLLSHYLQSVLKTNGFDVVGLWNQNVGLKFQESYEEQIFADWFNVHSEQIEEENSGESYDIDFEDHENVYELPPLKDFDELVAALTPVLQINNRPAAFILDWTDFQFGTIQTPMAPDDLESLRALSALMTGNQGSGKAANLLNRPPSTIILIAAKLSSIPPLLYQPEPRIKLFNIGLPERNSRNRFFERHLENMKLKSDPDKTRRRIIDDLADMTEGFKTMDLIQLMRLGRNEQNLSPEKLVNLYRFGQRKSPWEDLSEEKLTTVEEELKRRVVGQDNAVEHVATTIIKAAMGLSGIQHSAQMSKPKGVLFFVGPTGVGKTELAKATAEYLFGDENTCIRFDMSEYSHEESDQRLIGAPPGFVGFEEGGQLINSVLERPFSVLLFDEIEKAHPKILDKFLQILEDGRLTDGKGVTAYFSETIIIFTSNIGASKIKTDQDFRAIENEYISEVKSHFNNVLKRPELLNRIGDNIIVFNTIRERTLREEIIKRKLKPLQELIKSKYNVNLLLDTELYSYFEKRAEREHGGRGLLNAAERDFINPLSLYIFRNKNFLTEGRSIHVKYDGKSAENPISFDIIE